jgi:hypothetical protein
MGLVRNSYINRSWNLQEKEKKKELAVCLSLTQCSHRTAPYDTRGCSYYGKKQMHLASTLYSIAHAYPTRSKSLSLSLVHPLLSRSLSSLAVKLPDLMSSSPNWCSWLLVGALRSPLYRHPAVVLARSQWLLVVCCAVASNLTRVWEWGTEASRQL